MKIEVSMDNKEFIAGLEILNRLISGIDCKITVNSDGFKAIAMDPANVGVVALNYKPDFFKTFVFDGDGEEFTIRMADVYNLLKNMKSGDTELTLEDSRVKVKHESGGKFKRFTLPTIDTDDSRMARMPPLEYEMFAEVNSKDFQTALADLKEVSSDDGSVIIGFAGERFIVGSSDPLREGEIDMPLSGVNTNVKVKFAKDYLIKLVSDKVTDLVKVGLRDNASPIILKYETDKIDIQAVVAPRVGDA